MEHKNLSIKKYFFSILSISFCFIVLGMFAFQAGEEFQVNTYTDNHQRKPAIAMDKRGNFVITWRSRYQDGSEYGIFAQRFNKRGKALGSEFQVNTYTDGEQRDPAIAMDKRGNFVITWQSWEQDGSDDVIFAQRFNKKGIALGPEFQVNTYIDYDQDSPAIAMDKKGNFVITWMSTWQDGSEYGIYAQRFNKQGQALGSEFQVNTYTSDSQWTPAIAMDEIGNFVITWQSNGQDGSKGGIYAQRYNKQGQALGSEFQVNTYTDELQGDPAIGMDKIGNFVITWHSYGQDVSWYESRIYAQRFNKQGQALGSEFQVNTYPDPGQDSPAIAMDKIGNFVITWHSYGQDGSLDGIFAQRFNKKGKALGSEFQVNTYTANFQDFPAIAIDEKGNFVITWESYGQDGSDDGIFAKMFKK